MRKLIVHRKGYTRKDGTYVKPSTFKIEDRGTKGRGKKILPKLKLGVLGGKGFYSKLTSFRHSLYKKKCKIYGKRSVLGRLQALKVLNKRTNKPLYDKVSKDYKWVSKNC